MAISREFAEKMSNNSNWFNLKNNNDSATIRLMYDSLDDVEEDYFLVHQIKENNFNRNKECKRKEPGDPLEICPGCMSSDKDEKKAHVKVYYKVYNETEECNQVWERSYNYHKTVIVPFVNKMLKTNPDKKVVGLMFEITRNGAKGDTNTKYTLYPMGADNKQLSDFEENEGANLLQFEDNTPVEKPEKTKRPTDGVFSGL